MASSENTDSNMLTFPQSTWQASLLSAANSARAQETGTSVPSSTTKNSPVRGASLIVPRLYLSGFLTARNEQQMRALGVTHIVSVLEHAPKHPRYIKSLHIPLADTSDSNILDHLEVTTDFIKSALTENEENIVLVSLHGSLL